QDNEIGAEESIEKDDDESSDFLQSTMLQSKSSLLLSSSTLTLRRHLNKHEIITFKLHQRTIYKFRNDPYPEYEQQEQDKYVDQITSLFQEKREQLKLVVNQIPEKIAFTTDI
ncbi:16906_t:CDS:2, partial [Funneliformis geosporum]